MDREWQDSPTTRLTVGSIGSGDLVITSARTLYFNAQSNGHQRDEVGLTVRGVRYLVSTHFDLGPDGVWDFHGASSYDKRRVLYISRAGKGTFENVSEPARRTIEAMLLDAVRAWGQEVESTKLLMAGQVAHLNNDIMRHEEELGRAQAVVEGLQATLANLRLHELAITGGLGAFAGGSGS